MVDAWTGAMDTRKTIGERLLERIDRRADGQVRPSAATAFEDRYSRFARTRGMSRLGMSLFPDLGDAAWNPSADAGDRADPTFLSGTPFWARMRRLGQARLRRQQWLSGLGTRHGTHSIKTRSERSPVGLSSLFGPERLSIDSLVLLEPEPQQDAEMLPGEAGGIPGHTGVAGMSSVDSPWFSGSSFVPAPVVKGMRGDRPMARAESRAASTVIIQKVVERVVQAMKSGETEVTFEDLPAKAARKVRRAVRRQVKRLGLAQPEVEAELPDELLSPVALAAGRAPSAKRRR